MPYRIMVLNLGSTSFKFKYYPSGAQAPEAAGGVFENIGKVQSPYHIQIGGQMHSGTACVENHRVAFEIAVTILQQKGILRSLETVDAICYKAVHAGTLTGVQVVNDHLLAIMRQCSGFAPAHNHVYMAMMEEMSRRHSGLTQLACFETAFHTTIPEKRVMYGVPWEWMKELGIRRYGFHGSSHKYISEKMKELAPSVSRIISLHLGGSSSACAIKDGKSIACSMGATPQSGLFQNNRVGDFDIFCLPTLLQRYDGNLEYILKALSQESGLLGVSGVSNDLRRILEEAGNGNHRAALAVEAYCDNIVGYIGMFNAYLKGSQALVFTGGIGRNCAAIRQKVCDELTFMGVELDSGKNESNTEGVISVPDSPVAIYVLETNEELTLVRESQRYLDSCRAKELSGRS